MKSGIKLIAAGCALAASYTTQAASVQVMVTVENLAPTNSISFAPFRLGFNSGSYDAFDLGSAATAPIISIAEGGSGADWFPAFAAADPTAVLGTVSNGGPLLPGASASESFLVDTDVNSFFTFATMVVPSNDFFIGNDLPTAYELFDAAGNLQITDIYIGASEIWDAGSEIFDPAAAAFVGDNGLRADQNSVVAFNFAELAAFNGLPTAPGYIFDSQLTADSSVYRISFETTEVPVPAALPLFLSALGGVGILARRNRSTANKA